jgi:cytochrome oxidase Cu insertion factor (SCO1/SenC/PrrC family)
MEGNSMKSNATIFSFLLCLILVLPFASMAQYALGDSVTNFTLNDLDGNSVSLSDFAGQIVLLNFFTTW